MKLGIASLLVAFTCGTADVAFGQTTEQDLIHDFQAHGNDVQAKQLAAAVAAFQRGDADQGQSIRNTYFCALVPAFSGADRARFQSACDYLGTLDAPAHAQAAAARDSLASAKAQDGGQEKTHSASLARVTAQLEGEQEKVAAQQDGEQGKAQSEYEAPISVQQLIAFMDDGNLRGAENLIQERGIVRGPGGSIHQRRFDNGQVAATILADECVKGRINYMQYRRKCLRLLEHEKLLCIQNPNHSWSGEAGLSQAETLTDDQCGFRYPPFAEAIVADRAFVDQTTRQEKEAKDREQKTASARMAAETRARARSTEDPAYQRALVSDRLCFVQKERARLEAWKRKTERVDQESGSSDPGLRRQQAIAKINMDDETARQLSKYRKLGGRAVSDWCALRTADDIYKRFLAEEVARSTPTTGSGP